MKKIIINGRFLLHRITGVERYAREIITELDNLIQPGEIEIAIPPGVSKIPVYENIKVVSTGKLHNRLWEQISFPIYVKKQRGISLNLCNVSPLISPGIVCIHDMKIKAVPQYFNKKFLLWYRLLFFNAVKRAKYIITVSKFSKHEICRYYHVDKNKIYVIPNAWQHYKRVAYQEKTLKKYGLKKQKYFFSMSSLEPNKNFSWIAETAKKNDKQIFVVAGSVNKTVFMQGLGFSCPENMKLLGYISDEEAKTLMRDCKAFLFPTFYEGFGIPPLEAVAAGAKCIVVSDTEVMHEIFGEYVTYINPNKISDKLEVIINQNLPEILDKYSWKVSAQTLFLLLTECTGSFY